MTSAEIAEKAPVITLFQTRHACGVQLTEIASRGLGVAISGCTLATSTAEDANRSSTTGNPDHPRLLAALSAARVTVAKTFSLPMMAVA